MKVNAFVKVETARTILVYYMSHRYALISDLIPCHSQPIDPFLQSNHRPGNLPRS